MKAYVLAGGLGTRLYPYSLILPKPLLALGNKTILEHVLDWVSGHRFDEIVIAVSGRLWAYKLVVGDKYNGIKVSYKSSEKPLGTAGQLKFAAGEEKETFFATYSDVIIKAKIDKAIEAHRREGSIATVFTANVKEKLKYGVVKEEGGLLKDWEEKPEISFKIVAGAFLFEPEFLKYIKEDKYGMNWSIMNAVKSGEKVLLYDVESFLDLGNVDDYINAAKQYAAAYGEIP